MLRHTRSPACGSPETSSTLNRSRTPLTTTAARLLTSVSSCGPASTESSTMLLPPWSIGIDSVTSRPTGTICACAAPPSLRQVSLASAAETSVVSGKSSTRTVSGTSLPTRPKLGACLTTSRRSPSFGWPESSTFSGAPSWAAVTLASPAGTSCTSPSVSMTTPARRWRGTSASSRLSAAKSRVPSSPAPSCGFPARTTRNVEVMVFAELLGDIVHRRRGDGPAVADLLARRLVDDDDRDVALRRALFLHQRRIGEDRENQRQRRGAPGDAARPAPQPERQDQQRQCRQAGHRRPRDQRRESDGVGAGAHCPSRSRIAGTCTWSLL